MLLATVTFGRSCVDVMRFLAVPVTTASVKPHRRRRRTEHVAKSLWEETIKLSGGDTGDTNS